MKFDFVIGNPPYQGDNHMQIYPDFYLAGRNIGTCVCMIFPIGWQEPKSANNLGKLNIPEIKNDSQIVYIDNIQNAFTGISGAEWTNILLWKKGFDNDLNGCQRVFINGSNEKRIKLPCSIQDIQRPFEIQKLVEIVTQTKKFESMSKIVSSNKPYGLRKNVFTHYDKYNLPSLFERRMSNNDIRVYGKQKCMFIPISYPVPTLTERFEKYKVFIPSSWGNMSKNYLGGAYADIIVAGPKDICTETYVETGNFDSLSLAKKHAKYVMTVFARALLFSFKLSQQCAKGSWKNVPIQDYSEDFWEGTIDEIDVALMDKYNVPQYIRDFVFKNIQKKSEKNIINYFGEMD